MTLMTRLCTIGCIVALSFSGAAAVRVTEQAETTPDARPSIEERRILVTFHDERENRLPIGDPNSSYRRRGDYRNSTWSQRVASQLAQQYGLEQEAQWPITTLGIHCVVYRVPASQSLPGVVHQIAKDPRVEAVQAMKQFHVMSDRYNDPYLKLQAGFRSIHVESVHPLATGRNIHIAIVDTGVDESHPDLIGQVSKAENFVAGSPGGSGDIHGTAVAGIIAALANNGKGIVGVAPGARLISLKACWQNQARSPDADCNSLTLALALNAAITLKAEIINLSLAGPKDPLLERLLTKAVDEGTIVVASDPASTQPGEEFPAYVKNVIAVRTAGNNTAVSTAGPGAVTAPGTEILTTLPHDSYNFMSGSSFAAAHVTGLIALMLELNPTLTGQQITSMLHASGRISPASLAPTRTVDACTAIAMLRPILRCSDDMNVTKSSRPSGLEGALVEAPAQSGR